MSIFGDCPVCAAKDSHIAFLQDQVKALQDRLSELASPGSVARATWTQPPPREKKPASAASYSPSRLAQTRKDLPTAREGQAPRVMAQDIEASFKQ